MNVGIGKHDITSHYILCNNNIMPMPRSSFSLQCFDNARNVVLSMIAFQLIFVASDVVLSSRQQKIALLHQIN
jgi:hypothetical protein